MVNPIHLVRGGVLAVSAITAFGLKLYKDSKKIKMAILGMKGAGKTTILNKLRKIENAPSTTYIEEYKGFDYKAANKKITFSSGEDFGGGKDLAKVKYKKAIDNSNLILFVFSVDLYLSEADYMRDCNSRLDFIFQKKEKKRWAIIATHPDILDLPLENLPELIMEKTKDKVYNSLFSNLYIVNLMDDSDFENAILKIFK